MREAHKQTPFNRQLPKVWWPAYFLAILRTTRVVLFWCAAFALSLLIYGVDLTLQHFVLWQAGFLISLVSFLYGLKLGIADILDPGLEVNKDDEDKH